MSEHPGSPPSPRPRWAIPVAVLGVIFVVLGIVLSVDWGTNSHTPLTVTSTTAAVTTTVP